VGWVPSGGLDSEKKKEKRKKKNHDLKQKEKKKKTMTSSKKKRKKKIKKAKGKRKERKTFNNHIFDKDFNPFGGGNGNPHEIPIPDFQESQITSLNLLPLDDLLSFLE
jgi:hypothetical protein